MSSKIIITPFLSLLLCMPAFAQDEAAPDATDPVAPDAAAPAPEDGGHSERLAKLESELAELRKKVDEAEGEGESPGEALLSGWQFQLRAGWHTLAKNHRSNVFKRDDHQHGWMAGIAIQAPIYRELGPVDLYAMLQIEYRNLAYSTVTRAPITNASVTISYLDITAAPTVKFKVTEALSPYVFAGMTMQVASPPEDDISYLDLGATLGLGVDFKVTKKISVGAEYKYSWFGVASQERQDYGQLTGYIGFNF
ncbi:MAG TPA: hypothetical protein DEA08_07660 [Planctomycetes bacterium]|nr:hypothetical protein [Planctomycetota bacterium]